MSSLPRKPTARELELLALEREGRRAGREVVDAQNRALANVIALVSGQEPLAVAHALVGYFMVIGEDAGVPDLPAFMAGMIEVFAAQGGLETVRKQAIWAEVQRLIARPRLAAVAAPS